MELEMGESTLTLLMEVVTVPLLLPVPSTIFCRALAVSQRNGGRAQGKGGPLVALLGDRDMGGMHKSTCKTTISLGKGRSWREGKGKTPRLQQRR